MYVQSASSDLTPQGRAIKDAAVRFGDGETLPFSPCKRGYIPVVNGKRMYACHIHTKERRKRLKREGGKFRLGEKRLSDFWDLISKNNGEKKNEMKKKVKGCNDDEKENVENGDSANTKEKEGRGYSIPLAEKSSYSTKGHQHQPK
mmetsp:Transcript_4370/g.5978  ORF Transcript_4370/g.5978 Transcript_4370/m.5978 type:complete len:146 (-) Transcript_4370:99-536(-)